MSISMSWKEYKAYTPPRPEMHPFIQSNQGATSVFDVLYSSNQVQHSSWCLGGVSYAPFYCDLVWQFYILTSYGALYAALFTVPL